MEKLSYWGVSVLYDLRAYNNMVAKSIRREYDYKSHIEPRLMDNFYTFMTVDDEVIKISANSIVKIMWKYIEYDQDELLEGLSGKD